MSESPQTRNKAAAMPSSSSKKGKESDGDSFSSASFSSSDSEIEGKVSLGTQKSSQNDKRAKGGNYSKQADGKQDWSSKLGFVLRDTRFFIMKSNNEENIQLSKKKSVWATPPANESRINQAVRETRNVILIFSVKESGKFSGFARLAGESERGGQSVNWILPPGLTQRALGGILPLDWISTHELSFLKTQHLFNPWNDGKPVKIGRDGQEVEPRIASELCRLFPSDLKTDWSKIIRQSKDRISALPRVQNVSVAAGKRRPAEDDYNRFKRMRGSYDGYYGDRRAEAVNPSPRYTHSQAQDRNYDNSPRRNYSYSRSRAAYHRPPPPPMPYPPPPPFDSLPPPPRYYDIPALVDNYSSSGHHSSRGQPHTSTLYEKSVSDFLRRGGGGDRDRKETRSRVADREYNRRYGSRH